MLTIVEPLHHVAPTVRRLAELARCRQPRMPESKPSKHGRLAPFAGFLQLAAARFIVGSEVMPSIACNQGLTLADVPTRKWKGVYQEW